MNESLQAIGCPLTQLSVFMLSDIHTGLRRDSSAKLIAANNGQVKRKPGKETGILRLTSKFREEAISSYYGGCEFVYWHNVLLRTEGKITVCWRVEANKHGV